MKSLYCVTEHVQDWPNWLLCLRNLINNKIRESSKYQITQNSKSKASPTLVSGNIPISRRILFLLFISSRSVFACGHVIGVVCQLQIFNVRKFWLLNKYSSRNLRVRIFQSVLGIICVCFSFSIFISYPTFKNYFNLTSQLWAYSRFYLPLAVK